MTRPGTTERTVEEQVFSRQIGKNIRALREAAGLTQSELAQRMGVDQGTLSLYELGKTDMPTSRLLRIATILQIMPEKIVGCGENPKFGVENACTHDVITVRLIYLQSRDEVEVQIGGRSARVVIESSGRNEQPICFPQAA